MVSLTVSTAAKPPAFARSFPLTIDVQPEATVGQVKAAITAKFPKVRVYISLFVSCPLTLGEQFGAARQKITVKGGKKPLADETKLSTILGANLQDGQLQVKDLGAQISWRTVFLVEYVR